LQGTVSFSAPPWYGYPEAPFDELSLPDAIPEE
jgi:hypothetical protein